MILRPIVAIPTYNNAETIERVVLDVLRETGLPVLVIDDGSDRPIETVLTDPICRANLSSGQLRILRNDRNRGKGAALRAAMDDSVSLGFTHLVSMDGDGQHLAKEANKLVNAAKEHPWDLILGNRNLQNDHVPPISRFGRRFSNFWVKYETDRAISDSQSGLRVYPLFHTQNLRFVSRRFDFEIEVLIYLLWRGVRVREVDVEVSYAPSGERVSHFHKFWDNARISLLNSLLVALSLLRTHRSFRDVSLALGLGVWIGCTPFFGFHTLLAILFALLFRFNVVFVWLGTNISNPLIAPALTALSLAVGKFLLSKSIHNAGDFTVVWLTGSIVVGGVLGALVGGVAYATAVGIHRRNLGRKRGWTGRSRGGRFGTWFLKTVARRFGLRAAYACLCFIVPYFFLFAPKGRKACAEYWRILSPGDSWFRRQLRVFRHFQTFGQLLLDRVYQGFFSSPQFKIRPSGLEHLLPLLSSHRGFILVTAHCGAWEMSAFAFPTDTLKGPFYMGRYQATGFTLEQVIEPGLSAHLRTIQTNQPSQPILAVREVLTSGQPIGLTADRPMGEQYELVSFLGKLAPFDPTPFRIAALCGAPLLFSFGFKDADETYEFFATPPALLRFDPGVSHELQCFNWLAAFTAELETRIRRYPYQWANFYPFWSTPIASKPGEEEARSRNHLLQELHRPPERRAEAGSDAKATAAQ